MKLSILILMAMPIATIITGISPEVELACIALAVGSYQLLKRMVKKAKPASHIEK
jgi:hypothetical protein